MTLRYLKQLCKEQKVYQTPELNDILYLHFKGFSKLDNLEHYHGLKSLWLEGNGISKLENLGYFMKLIIDALVQLRCLFLQQNCISVMENLDQLVELDTLNLSNNMIRSIEGLSCLGKITSLTLAHNFLIDSESLLGVLDCPNIAYYPLLIQGLGSESQQIG